MTRLQAHSRATAYSRAPRTDYRPYIAVAALLALFLTASHFAPPVTYSVRPGPSHTSHQSNYDLDVLVSVSHLPTANRVQPKANNNVSAQQRLNRRP